MFTSRLSLPTIIDLCRMLRHQISAGLSLHQVMTQQSQRGPVPVRPIAGRLSDAIRGGSSLSKALDEEKAAFPPLFLSLVKLGETTGHLTEVFGELERYYQLELQLRRQFRSQTFMPIVQFVFAVLIVAGVLFILGLVNPSKPLLTIFGLGGGAGALAFLGVVFGSLLGAWSLYFLLTRLGRQKAWMDRFLLGTPALGPCLHALIMSRFTLALQLTLDTGLSITKALRLSLEATGNAYFASRADLVVQTLKNGESLHEALAASGLFTDDFLGLVASSEASGRVPEMMRHQSEFYHEETARKMKLLTMVAGGAVWTGVAGFIIWCIFKLAFIYLDALSGKI